MAKAGTVCYLKVTMPRVKENVTSDKRAGKIVVSLVSAYPMVHAGNSHNDTSNEY